MGLSLAFRLLKGSLKHDALRAALTLFTIILSIASFFSILTFNMNVMEAFRKTLEAFSGRATLEIHTPKVGIPEGYLETVREMDEVKVAAPVVRGMVLLKGLKDLPVQVIGIDPFSDSAIRSYESGDENVEDPLKFLSSPSSVLLPKRLAQRLGLDTGGRFEVLSPSGAKKLEVRGTVREVGPATIFGGEVLIMDYWAAQALLAKTESVDEISVLAKEGVAVAGLKAELARVLPGYVNIEEPQLRKEGGTRILGSLEFLLGSVGMLVMGVAFFVAYNTFQVAFLRRSREFAILRLEGATTPQLIGFLLTETLLIGVLGSLLGVWLGFWLAKLNFLLGKEMVATLYFRMLPREMTVSQTYGMLTGGVGLLVSILAGVVPALSMRRLSPLEALRPIDFRQNGALDRSKATIWMSAFMLCACIAVVNVRVSAIPVFLKGALAILLAFGAFGVALPVLLRTSAKVLRLVLRDRALLKLGTEQFERTAKRSTFAAFAVLLSFTLFIGIELILKSFQGSVYNWAMYTIRNDLTVLPKGAMPGRPTFPLSQDLRGRIARVPFVESVGRYRAIQVRLPEKDYECTLQAYDFNVFYRYSKDILIKGHPPSPGAPNEVVVSYTLSRRLGLDTGDTFLLAGKTNARRVKVAAVIQDYSSERGIVGLDYASYQEMFQDSTVESFSVYLKPGTGLEAARAEIYRVLEPATPVSILSNKEFKAEVLSIMDRFFMILSLIAYTALGIGAFSMASILISQVRERQSQLSFLRAIGASRRQVKGLIYLETFYLAAFGWLFGSVLGWIMARLGVILIGEGTGFFIGLRLDVQPFAMALAAGGTLALLTSMIPARQAAGLEIVKGLQYE